MPPPLTHTFPNGAAATVRPLSQFTIARLQVAAQKRLPKPDAPLAPGPGGDMAPNEADPTYQGVTLPAWQEQIGLLMNDLLLDMAVDVLVNDEELEQLRRDLERLDAPLDEVSDKVAYIKHCCLAGVGSAQAFANEFKQVLALILGQSAPTEADVQAHVETFPRDVGGA